MPHALNPLNGARIYYEVEGHGPPLFLHHGMTGGLDASIAHSRPGVNVVSNVVHPGSEKARTLKSLILEHFGVGVGVGVGGGQVCLLRPPGNYTFIISWVPPRA